MALWTRVITPILLERIHQRQGIHDGRQHAHIVGGRAVHAEGVTRFAAPQVAGANNDGNIHAHFPHFAHPQSNILRTLRVDTISLRSRQRFAAQL